MKAHGFISIQGEGGEVKLDTFRCPHCGGIFTLKPREAPPGSCWNKCGGAFICKGCVGKPCTPFMKAIEEQEARDRFRRQLSEDYR